jgi:hypothetical protein
MDWGTLLSTLVGAIIGVTSTLLADRVRWRRESEQRGRDVRLEVYGRFLTALNEAAESLWVVGLGDRRPAEPERLDELLRAEVHRAGLYSLREQIMILAADNVRRSADLAVDRVREYRDCLIGGSDSGSAEEIAATDAYKAAVKELRDAMRVDVAK